MIGRWFAFIPPTKYYATNIKQISNCLVPYISNRYEHACMHGWRHAFMHRNAWRHAFLCITTHPILTCTPFLALVVATSAMILVIHWVHTLPFATNLCVPTLLTTLPTVKPVCHLIHTHLLAAIWTRASLNSTNPRVLVTCHESPSLG
jgi:hypothetical protein